ncbi:MAG: ComF family protein [Proteiniphilum sp.]|jgi:ComF family protein|nr:ComF family protein [Proteiniphilum sp.]
MKRNEWIRQLLHLFYPNVCVICGSELLQEEEGACLQCLYRLPKTYNFREPGNGAERLMSGRIPFERIASFCVYTKGGILQPLIHHLKYHNGQPVGLLLGRMFGKDLLGSDFLRPVELIVPVPVHPKRKKTRGYNQAEIIAKGLSETTGIPLSTDNLLRAIHNPTQTKRDKTQRWENVKDIFKVTDPGLFEQKHLLLVDDVITTGSTLEACGTALMTCTGVRISIATLGEAR